MAESIQLHLLQPGQRATITKINGASALRRRFIEMGIVKGETILIERHAPLGDPVEYFIKGYHLALRKEEAAQIDVILHEGLVYPENPLSREQQKAFSDQIKELGGGGVDVIYDGVGGDYAEPAVRALNWEGRFLVIGFPAGIPNI